MNSERLMKIILAPHVTEKAAVIAEQNRQIVFKVACDADKLEVKQAVEKLFEVKVTAVQMANIKGKRKRFGAVNGKRNNTKKAYVTLAEGHDINFADVS